MRAHLTTIREALAARPATRLDLAERRRALLGYLGEYIAKGITPRNTRLPWRSPVFIDDDGAICAVGYLIERSVGRSLAERIAAAHPFDFLEEIAAAMPAVRAWIDSSGFTLEELASIQPGYEGPLVERWTTWDLQAKRPRDGAYQDMVQGVTTRGTFANGQMEGAWTRVDGKGNVIGSGEMK